MPLFAPTSDAPEPSCTPGLPSGLLADVEQASSAEVSAIAPKRMARVNITVLYRRRWCGVRNSDVTGDQLLANLVCLAAVDGAAIQSSRRRAVHTTVGRLADGEAGAIDAKKLHVTVKIKVDEGNAGVPILHVQGAHAWCERHGEFHMPMSCGCGSCSDHQRIREDEGRLHDPIGADQGGHVIGAGSRRALGRRIDGYACAHAISAEEIDVEIGQCAIAFQRNGHNEHVRLVDAAAGMVAPVVGAYAAVGAGTRRVVVSPWWIVRTTGEVAPTTHDREDQRRAYPAQGANSDRHSCGFHESAIYHRPEDVQPWHEAEIARTQGTNRRSTLWPQLLRLSHSA